MALHTQENERFSALEPILREGMLASVVEGAIYG